MGRKESVFPSFYLDRHNWGGSPTSNNLIQKVPHRRAQSLASYLIPTQSRGHQAWPPQQIKALDSCALRIRFLEHVVEGENRFLRLSSDLHVHAISYMAPSHIHQTYKHITSVFFLIKKKKRNRAILQNRENSKKNVAKDFK